MLSAAKKPGDKHCQKQLLTVLFLAKNTLKHWAKYISCAQVWAVELLSDESSCPNKDAVVYGRKQYDGAVWQTSRWRSGLFEANNRAESQLWNMLA